MNLKMNNLI